MSLFKLSRISKVQQEKAEIKPLNIRGCKKCSSKYIFDTIDQEDQCVPTDKKVIDCFVNYFCSLITPCNICRENTFEEIVVECKKISDNIFSKTEEKCLEDIKKAVNLINDSQCVKMWGFVHVGCGSGNITLNVANKLDVEAQGIDLLDRRHLTNADSMLHFVVSDDTLQIPESTFQFVLLDDILHHMKYPELQIKNLIEKMDKNECYIIVRDFDCTSWEHSYYLDSIHYVYSEISENVSYLPVRGYRKREYWRQFFVDQGFMIKYSKDPEDPLSYYVDLFTRA